MLDVLFMLLASMADKHSHVVGDHLASRKNPTLMDGRFSMMHSLYKPVLAI